ncbi:MAG TPA: methyltransferase [Gaiellaceae bacterium]|nr:methyltransferase [Gaiellaceae bacterium]
MTVPALGRRGGGWVVLQFAIMAAIVAGAFLPPRWPDAIRPVLAVVGGIVSIAGAGFAAWAGRELGKALTPYPRPSSGELVEHGPFRLVRHPVYAGALLFFAGVGLFSSLPSLALTGVLGIVWALKLRVEERFLRQTYPAYAGYCERVRWRLVPGIY